MAVSFYITHRAVSASKHQTIIAVGVILSLTACVAYPMHPYGYQSHLPNIIYQNPPPYYYPEPYYSTPP